jgi:hypothetical protein
MIPGRVEVTRGQFRPFVDDRGYKTEAERDGKGGYGLVAGQWKQDPRFVRNADLGFEPADDHPVVAKVRLRAGGEQWILLHLEVQSGREAGFEVRVARYNSGRFWIFEQRVVTLVVLADLDDDWRPNEAVFQVADFESRLRFPVCKLIDRLESDWRADHSLPVQIARAQIAALRTACRDSRAEPVSWTPQTQVPSADTR